MNDIEKEKIIITYQGAFSPPTLGHKDGARKLMQKAIELYPTKTIELKFMPSNDAESKDSLNKTKSMKSYMSFEERRDCLNAICLSLKPEFKNNNYTFSVSDIEQEFTKINPPITSKTICTLMVLSKQNPDAEIILGIGADNMANMIDWAHSLAHPYPTDRDPINKAQLEAIGVDIPQEYYYKDYINKIFVLDRTVNNGELVSDTPVKKTIDGINGEVINIPELDYTTSDSTTKPIPIVRTKGWGRTDVENVKTTIINESYGTIKIYLLDPPLPENVSSSKVRNMIESNEDIKGLVPQEIMELPSFTKYVTRINKYYKYLIKTPTTPGGGKRKKYTKKQKNKKQRKSVKKQRKYKL